MTADFEDPLLGRLFAGRFRVERRLGAGGMGAVYVARQVALDRLVALKVLPPAAAADDAAMRRFELEMRATARVEHPNTVRVYDFGESDDGRPFLAMELLDGPTLGDVIRTAAPLPTARIVRIAGQIARALGAAHAEGIVHRDLKPDNVMLVDRYGERDVAKVLDFGIARFAAAAFTRLTEAGSLLGTPLCMSPEQALGEATDARSDLYALGVVLYQLVTGQAPFDDPVPVRILYMHVHDTPVPPSQRVGPVDAALERLILDLLQKDPARRPQTAAAVLARLSEVDDHGQPVAPRPAAPPPASPPRTEAYAGTRPTLVDPTWHEPDVPPRHFLPPPLPPEPRPPVALPLQWALSLVGLVLAVVVLAAAVRIDARYHAHGDPPGAGTIEAEVDPAPGSAICWWRPPPDRARGLEQCLVPREDLDEAPEDAARVQGSSGSIGKAEPARRRLARKPDRSLGSDFAELGRKVRGWFD